MRVNQNTVILDFVQKGAQITLPDSFREFKKKLSNQEREIAEGEEIAQN